MVQLLKRWMKTILLGTASAITVASATPALPASSLATTAVQAALASAPAAAPLTAQATQNAAQTRAASIAQVQSQADTLAASVIRGRSAIVRATAYNSVPGQTDSTPFITATGTRVRMGVVALSRDLLRQFPYGSKIMIEDLSGRYSSLFSGRVFYVEDTMAARKTSSIDIWMGTRSQAINFGARQVRITAVR